AGHGVAAPRGDDDRRQEEADPPGQRPALRALRPRRRSRREEEPGRGQRRRRARDVRGAARQAARVRGAQAMTSTPETPLLTTDVIIELEGGIVLIRRRNPPLGWALPGGFVDRGEAVA